MAPRLTQRGITMAPSIYLVVSCRAAAGCGHNIFFILIMSAPHRRHTSMCEPNSPSEREMLLNLNAMNTVESGPIARSIYSWKILSRSPWPTGVICLIPINTTCEPMTVMLMPENGRHRQSTKWIHLCIGFDFMNFRWRSEMCFSLLQKHGRIGHCTYSIMMAHRS